MFIKQTDGKDMNFFLNIDEYTSKIHFLLQKSFNSRVLRDIKEFFVLNPCQAK
jgi:hypothetical protein